MSATPLSPALPPPAPLPNRPHMQPRPRRATARLRWRLVVRSLRADGWRTAAALAVVAGAFAVLGLPLGRTQLVTVSPDAARDAQWGGADTIVRSDDAHGYWACAERQPGSWGGSTRRRPRPRRSNVPSPSQRARPSPRWPRCNR